eukprot:8959744-Pyramimonas_sp.AAC.1
MASGISSRYHVAQTLIKGFVQRWVDIWYDDKGNAMSGVKFACPLHRKVPYYHREQRLAVP